MSARAPMGALALALAAALVLGAGEAQAQTPVCSNAPEPGERIECTEPTTSIDVPININVQDLTIETMDAGAHGIHGKHEGEGAIYIDVTGGEITTENLNAHAIYGSHRGAGNVDIYVQGAAIETMGRTAYGIHAYHAVSPIVGNVDIYVENTTIETMGASAFGVIGWHQGDGRTNIDVRDATITTAGRNAFGVYGFHQGDVTTNIDVRDTTITATGGTAHAIFGRSLGTGDIHITANEVDITTASSGVVGFVNDDGDITIDVLGGSIKTTGRLGYGVYGIHATAGITVRIGDIDIDVLRGATIATMGDNAYGIYAHHYLLPSVGDIDINAREGSAITTTGAGAHGIYAEHDSGTGEIRIAVLNGGSVHADGAGASGVRVGSLSAQGAVERAAGMDEEGYRRQTVTVNGRVWGGTGEAAGVYLAGGGRVVIGPQGSVGAESGIAILATGDTPGATEQDPPIKPKLYLALNPGGRRLAEVIGDDYILNDGGETTIVLNNVKLHDGATGATGLTAPNGAWDVTMRAEGVTVDRTTTPGTLTPTEPTASVIADRDFSAGDFDEKYTPRPIPASSAPQPEPEPEPPVEQLTFTEVYAPRAALYEALPGLLLRLNGREPLGGKRLGLPGPPVWARLSGGERLTTPGSPVWARLSGSRGSYASERSTVGAAYDFKRLIAEAGLNVSLGENLTGSLSARSVQSSADVDSPVGGGEIEAKGIGLGLGVSWRRASGYYVDGRFSLTDYDAEVSSDTRGTLARDADALAHSLDVEVGRRFQINEKISLTPRAWLTRSAIDVDAFTDAVDARVSLAKAVRFTGGLGMVTETLRVWEGGALSLRGSLDIEQTLDDAETLADVSGNEARIESRKDQAPARAGRRLSPGPLLDKRRGLDGRPGFG